MEPKINTHPGFGDVKVGSLVYCQTRFGGEWQTGLVVRKCEPCKDSSYDSHEKKALSALCESTKPF